MKITITAGQAIMIHGWLKARKILLWGDVLANAHINFKFLNNTCRLTTIELHKLQPDIEAWMTNDKIDITDFPIMAPLWEINIMRDCKKIDLADIIKANWDAKDMQKLGITYKDLCDLGLTPHTMPLLGLTLHGWASIGFTRQHASTIQISTLVSIFKGMSWQDVLNSLK